MPIRKTSKGWWWGSKGPFKTKAKAEEVRRAAYAGGYKGESAIVNNLVNDGMEQ